VGIAHSTFLAPWAFRTLKNAISNILSACLTHSFSRVVPLLFFFNAGENMKILSELEYIMQAEPILRKVFSNDNPTENPFSVNISERLLVSPWNYVQTELIEAVITAASDSGNGNCYLTNLGRHEREANHCHILLTELHDKNEYLSHRKVVNRVTLDVFYWIDYIIYSDRGTWGIMISHENFAVIWWPF
jgi:hypothetical protein